MGTAPVAGLEIRREALVLDVGTIRATHVAAPRPSRCPPDLPSWAAHARAGA
jgi:hypothetical protein